MIFLGSAALAAATASVAANNDKYPRLAIISTAGPQKYASSFQTYAAKFHVVIINGAYEGWQ